MAIGRSHRLLVSLIFLVIVSILVIGGFYNSGISNPLSTSKHHPAPRPKPIEQTPFEFNASDWQFDPERDARHYGLNDQQCNAAFPDLWEELERSRQHQEKNGTLSTKDFSIGWSKRGTLRAMIYNRQLFILEVKGCARFDFRERSTAILQSIHRAIVAYPGPIPDIEFTFNVEDIPNDEQKPIGTTWALTKRKDDDNLWLMPDFGYWSWATNLVGSYERVLDKSVEDKPSFRKKNRKVLWRGSVLNEQREELVKEAQGKPWADVEPVTWVASPKSNMIPIHDHCNYMFLIHTEGRSYSGRLKYLLNCQSVVVIPEPLEWVEYFHHLLIPSGPDQNYISVKSDFSDLEEKMKYYQAHLDLAEKIAENGVKTFRNRYLTPAAQACYWRKLFATWPSAQPELYKNDKSDDWRGIPFETYILNDIKDIALEGSNFNGTNSTDAS